MIQLRNFYNHKFYPIVFAFILSSLFMMPMLKTGLPYGHDILYHLSRIMGSFELLNAQVFPAKVLPGFYFDYGYAVGLFYPTALLYIPVFIMKLGVGIIPAYLIFIFMINFGTVLSIFYSTRIILKSKYVASIASILYLFSSYRAFADFYTRQALGEFIGLMFIPLVFLGIYYIIFDNPKKWPILTLSMVGLITSHTLTTLLAGFYLTILCISNIKRFKNEPKRVYYLVLSAIMTLGLTSNYLLSMWQMMNSDTFRYSIPWTQAKWNAISSIQYLFYGFWKVSELPYGLDYITGFIVVIGTIVYFKKMIRNPLLKYMLVLTVLSLFLTTNLTPLIILEKMNFMQFPWRLFVFITYFTSVLGAYILGQIKYIKFKYVLTLSLIIYTLLSYFGFVNYYVKNNSNFNDFPGYSPKHTIAEFLPLDADMPKLIVRSFNQMVYSNNEIDYTYSKDAASYTVYFSGNTQSDTILEVPLLYYRGYAAYVTSPQGNEFLDISDSENSLINVNLGNYTEGTIRVFYNGTTLQKIASLFQLGFILLFIGVLIIKYLLENNMTRKSKFGIIHKIETISNLIKIALSNFWIQRKSSIIKAVKMFINIPMIIFLFLFTSTLIADLIQRLWLGYFKESWNITEFLINYQGGFVRRGLLGEVILKTHRLFGLDVYSIIIGISIVAYLILIIYFIKNFVRNRMSLVIFPFVFFLGGPIISDFWIRKDILIILIFILIVNLAVKQSRIHYFMMNLVFILGILIHENIGFITFPIIFLVLIGNISDNQKSSYFKPFRKVLLAIAVLIPSIIAFLSTLYFKGSFDVAYKIWESWKSINFPLQSIDFKDLPTSIDALSWTLDRGLSLFQQTLTNYDGGIYAPLAWLSILVLIYYVLTNYDVLLFRKGSSERHQSLLNYFGPILLIQLISILPLFIIGWDYGRWVFYWVSSSFIVYFTVKPSVLDRFIPRCINIMSRGLNHLFQQDIFRNRGVMILVLLFIGAPGVGWHYGIFKHTAAYGYIIDTVKSLLQFIPLK